jgi:hypothetical protein
VSPDSFKQSLGENAILQAGAFLVVPHKLVGHSCRLLAAIKYLGCVGGDAYFSHSYLGNQLLCFFEDLSANSLLYKGSET